ncbi:hypothetical protein [Paraburkholderia sp.]|uniref:hypothetical protein n=1 Tax=Paraburkholderia sp. TaxID=1926495 RepID=UPI0023A5B671|nr:hypothetical protein [Paraburkholderia sp.]MDE1184458.1 hypothetical protein [Paraburkholderia sp.]
MTLLPQRRLRPCVSAALCACALAAAPIHAQTASKDVGASMVKPPDAASSAATNPHNPDNMPIKKPAKPPHDAISRTPPASAANAK